MLFLQSQFGPGSEQSSLLFPKKKLFTLNLTSPSFQDKEQCSNDTGTDSELPLPVFHPEGKPSTRRNNEAGGGGTKWLTATITKLKGGLKTKKDHNVVVMEKRYEVAEAKKKNDSARDKAGSRREKKQ